MLERCDLNQKLDKATYRSLIAPLVSDLGVLQRRARQDQVPIIIVLEGWDAAGKGDTIAQLASGLDPRGFNVYRMGPPTEEERLNPFLRRFWLQTPARGRIAVFGNSWYRWVLFDRLEGLCSRREWEQACREINEFERQLVDDGTVLIKFWLHLSKKEQKRRFRECEKNPRLSWKVGEGEWRRYRRYKRLARLADEVMERTETARTPWTVVAATDRRYRRVKVLETVCQTVRKALADRSGRTEATEEVPAVSAAEAPDPAPPESPNLLDRVDPNRSLTRQEYDAQLKPYQEQLRDLEFECYIHRLGVVIVFEGWDAAGKGGTIRRVTRRLDPRGYTVVPVAAPTGEEATHHYLWRFWKHIPKAGHLGIFDRSWYGRVLVERVEGFCTDAAWRRAYREINEFERSLANAGWVVVKLWLHISPEEQLRRFEQRRADHNKSYKLTDEDWRNRRKWDLYRQAVVDMLRHTSTPHAPWTIVESNCKYYARIKALRTIISAIQTGLRNGARKS